MQALLKFVFGYAVKTGDLTVVTAKGRVLRFGDGTGAPVTIRFNDSAAERALALDPAMKLGELFTDSRLLVEQGSIYDFLHLMLRDLRNMKPPLLFRLIDRVQMALWRWLPKNKPEQSRRNVAHHYDLGDALYALFLDPDWQYSCAYFEYPGQSLADAQLAKKRHIAAKLLIEPTSSVLDIGSGWGGLALYLAKVAGAAAVTGVTLSDEQIARARLRTEATGLNDRVQFRLEDYRAVQGQFDRVVSVGMFEHVGLGFYDEFFSTSRRLLRDEGVMLLHTIGSVGTPGPTNPWILKYIFPGGHIPSLSDIVPPIERSGLVITDIEMLGPHYAETLLAWRTNFMARRDEAERLYDARFCRMWEFYLALSEVAFRTNDITIYQIQLSRERQTVPLTRDYLAAAEETLRTREKA
ncbi:cyclopropane-fatty-acyl-phospholipid synthase family protein [Caulobacter sp. S45]|uniref:SAM-dependent methyltransferase n=1 Tax=Caulobacter sp. S45 TaxID=1641861 RepID=UPI00131D942E|nr:cyclopropane-fatty-acyl-phospholipid synthase family protein [Caulobacter sp. S45]